MQALATRPPLQQAERERGHRRLATAASAARGRLARAVVFGDAVERARAALIGGSGGYVAHLVVLHPGSHLAVTARDLVADLHLAASRLGPWRPHVLEDDAAVVERVILRLRDRATHMMAARRVHVVAPQTHVHEAVVEGPASGKCAEEQPALRLDEHAALAHEGLGAWRLEWYRVVAHGDERVEVEHPVAAWARVERGEQLVESRHHEELGGRERDAPVVGPRHLPLHHLPVEVHRVELAVPRRHDLPGARRELAHELGRAIGRVVVDEDGTREHRRVVRDPVR
mmetsp:Transcript_29934/g.91116  ORF Transcript_29934/g.91116 Transcript_29934/m.91116 type:complete len:285 (-) Transcript_29934:155-1009(-)